MTNTAPKTFVFVLMPFHGDFDDIYHLGIKAACEQVGVYCERADEQLELGNIMERVYNNIAKSDIIIADMTGRNANVFYEVGYAHALNKQVILLTHNSSDIPFDLNQYPHIVYEGKISAKLKPELEKRLRWCIENPRDSLTKVEVGLEFFINATPIIDNPTIDIKVDNSYQFIVHLDIHNKSNNIITSDIYDIALIIPNSVNVMLEEPKTRQNVRSTIAHTANEISCNLIKLQPLFPDAWDRIVLMLRTFVYNNERILPFTIRLFTSLGTKDYPYSTRLSRAIPLPQA